MSKTASTSASQLIGGPVAFTYTPIHIHSWTFHSVRYFSLCLLTLQQYPDK